jgi:hypothetical protein
MEAVTEVVSKASDYLWNVILIILLPSLQTDT